MSDQSEKSTLDKPARRATIGMGVGVALGIAIGAAINNIALGLACGIIIGGIGVVIAQRRKQNK